MQYKQLDKTILKEMLVTEKKKLDEFKKMNLKLDISRGKPCAEQLNLSMAMLDCITSSYKITGTDYRNYGLVDGIVEFKNIFAKLLDVTNEEMIVGGNSSLNMMYDTLQRAYQFGILGAKPWNQYPKIKFICPVPGYDRHFSISKLFDMEMISVPMDEHGPIMTIVEELVASDETIKGIWCVPKYSNPSGIVYSDEVVDRLASMKTAAKDFRIMWDNAYFIHSLGEQHHLKNILRACEHNANADRVYIFGSTSKVTFAGAGVAFMAGSEKNMAAMRKLINIQTIGPDKINQLAHAEFFKTPENVIEHMTKHSALIRPKFEMVLNLLEQEFSDSDIVKYTIPLGGYFISVNLLDGTAKAVCKLCQEAGLVITAAGSTYPNMQDDLDSNLRIAPTYATNSVLDIAGQIFVCCVKIAAITKILG